MTGYDVGLVALISCINFACLSALRGWRDPVCLTVAALCWLVALGACLLMHAS